MNEEVEKGRPGLPVDLGRIGRAILSQWRLLPKLAILGAIVGVSIAFFLMHPVYTAKAVLVWDRANADPMDRSFVTQVESARLPANLKEVQKRLKLTGSVDDLQKRVDIIASDNQSRLVTVEATDGTPEGATTLAKTVVDVWLNQQRDLGHDRGSDRLTELRNDQKDAEQQLLAARQKLDKFQTELGVADYFGELKVAIAKVETLKNEINSSTGEAEAEAARSKELARQGKGLKATVVSTATISDPNSIKLSELQSQLASESSHLSDDHPTIIRLKELVRRLRTQRGTTVQSAASVTANPLKAQIEADLVRSQLAREAALTRAIVAKRTLAETLARVTKLTSVQGNAQALAAELETQEKHAAELKALIIQAGDQVRAVPSDFRVVTQASAPEHANPSKRRAVAVAFPVVFLLIGILALVGRALQGLKVHTAQEAAYWFNAPVVASTTWPRESGWHQLANELADAAPRGTTLVIPARSADLQTASMVTTWMEDSSPYVRVAPGVQVQGTTAIATLPANTQPQGSAITVAQAWTGPTKGQALRRASRLADRVLVVVPSGALSMLEIIKLKNRLGRKDGIGILLVGLRPEFADLADRVGEVDQFWQHRLHYEMVVHYPTK